jgi:hypothetical protein
MGRGKDQGDAFCHCPSDDYPRGALVMGCVKCSKRGVKSRYFPNRNKESTQHWKVNLKTLLMLANNWHEKMLGSSGTCECTRESINTGDLAVREVTKQEVRNIRDLIWNCPAP